VADVSYKPSGVLTNRATEQDNENGDGAQAVSSEFFAAELASIERQAKLVDVVAQSVIPELLEKFDGPLILPDGPVLHAGEQEILRLAEIVIGPDDGETIRFLETLRVQGLSLDDLHQELLEPTARRLGELWDDDRLDFFDVTIGVARLQRMVHYFARLDRIPPYDELRRILLAETPGEQHSFGMTVVSRFLVAAGWSVRSDHLLSVDGIEALLAREWFGVVGFSLASNTHIDQLVELIERVRQTSLNRSIGIMVGGPAFLADPYLVERVGADGMAINGPAAVILAKKLLAKCLLAFK
jgi:methanogenic corrinoid protein MtbC1